MRAALVAFAGLCALLAVAVYVFSFDTQRGRRWDAATLDAAVAQRDVPAVQRASSGLIRTIDIGSLVLLGGAIVGIALLLGNVAGAAGAIVLIVCANLTTQVLKPLLGETQPFGPRGDFTRSFPSGHATVAMSLALAAVLAAPIAWKLLVALGGAAYAAGMGISLLVQAGHYPSDVAGAYLVTAAWAGAIAAVLPIARGVGRNDAVRGGIAAAGAAAAAFALVVAVAVHRHPGIVVRVEVQTKLVLILTTLAALALILAAGLALLLQAMALRTASTTRS